MVTDLSAAVADEQVRQRYAAKVRHVDGDPCAWWVGAVSGRGTGRFWLGPGVAIIAHRYGFALANGVDALFHPDGSRVLLAHSCDNPLCQAPEHLSVATPAQNRAEWDRRRSNLGSPLRDIRGARGRAMAVRAALLTGGDVAACLRAGMTAVDRDQLTLF